MDPSNRLSPLGPPTRPSFRDLSFWERRCFAVSLWDYLFGERLPLDVETPLGRVRRLVSRRWLDRMEAYGMVTPLGDWNPVANLGSSRSGARKRSKDRHKHRRKGTVPLEQAGSRSAGPGQSLSQGPLLPVVGEVAAAVFEALEEAGPPILSTLVRRTGRPYWEVTLAAAIIGAALVERSGARGEDPDLRASCRAVVSELTASAQPVYKSLLRCLEIVRDLLGDGVSLPEAIGFWAVAEADAETDLRLEHREAEAVGMLVLTSAGPLAGASARPLANERSIAEDQRNVSRVLADLRAS